MTLSEYIKLAIIDYRLTIESKDENIMDVIFSKRLQHGVCYKFDKMGVNEDDRAIIMKIGFMVIKDNKLYIKYKHLRDISSDYWFSPIFSQTHNPDHNKIRQLLLARVEVLELILEKF